MYLVFVMTFTNFVLIFYRLLIEQIEFLEDVITNLWIFVVIFLSICMPVAILIRNGIEKPK